MKTDTEKINRVLLVGTFSLIVLLVQRKETLISLGKYLLFFTQTILETISKAIESVEPTGKPGKRTVSIKEE
jgi:hypothetical protein